MNTMEPTVIPDGFDFNIMSLPKIFEYVMALIVFVMTKCRVFFSVVATVALECVEKYFLSSTSGTNVNEV